jgi:two-component system, OmpR family, sensor kinase
MSRIPIRLRLTLPFAAAMALVLGAMGVFIYLRVGSALLASVDASLRAQLTEAIHNADEGRRLVDADASEGPFLSAVARNGRIVEASSTAAAALPVRDGVTRPTLFTSGDRRVIEAPAEVDGRPSTVIVAHPLTTRTETLRRVSREFLFAAPAALLVAVLAGYGLAAAALRPVEAMRRRAAAVTADRPGRLPVPPARDEIQALALTLNDMLARLEASFEHERRFLGDASHELRTPLALLRAELEFALRRERSRTELEAAVRSAAEETLRLSRLAEDLLFVARGDQGKLPVHRERLEAGEVLERVRERFAAAASQIDRDLVVGVGREILLDADRDRLEQALGNLVENALVHGGGTVELSAAVVNGTVELHVRDRGAGLPSEFAGRAFDRFSRADEARGRGGTGLGLAIVESIAQAHDGDAGAVNRPDGGLDAWISVPRNS